MQLPIAVTACTHIDLPRPPVDNPVDCLFIIIVQTPVFGKIISDTISQITEKLEVEREIRTAISSKRLEQRIMNVVPIGILLYLKLASPGYLAPLYDNAAGIVIMAVSLGVYASAWLLSEKIVRIEV